MDAGPAFALSSSAFAAPETGALPLGDYMSLWIAHGAWLLQSAQAAVDTPVVRMVSSERGWFETVTGLASGIMTLACCADDRLVPAAGIFGRATRRSASCWTGVRRHQPDRAALSTIADNVDYITTSIRVDVQQVNQTLPRQPATQSSVALAEQRLNEFNALIQVVQQEAEDTFVSTASTVRGVREGAATFRRQALDGHALPEADLLDDEPLEEELDGDDGTNDELDYDDAPGEFHRAAPRIRPRERG